MTDVISIMEQITMNPSFSFSDYEPQRNGEQNKLNVYHNEQYVGAIRFADHDGKYAPSVDQSVINELSPDIGSYMAIVFNCVGDMHICYEFPTITQGIEFINQVINDEPDTGLTSAIYQKTDVVTP